MSAFIRVRCPGCSARIKAPYQLIGLTRNCPNCQRQLTIEATPPRDAGPILTMDESPRPTGRHFSDAF